MVQMGGLVEEILGIAAPVGEIQVAPDHRTAVYAVAEIKAHQPVAVFIRFRDLGGGIFMDEFFLLVLPLDPLRPGIEIGRRVVGQTEAAVAQGHAADRVVRALFVVIDLHGGNQRIGRLAADVGQGDHRKGLAPDMDVQRRVVARDEDRHGVPEDPAVVAFAVHVAVDVLFDAPHQPHAEQLDLLRFQLLITVQRQLVPGAAVAHRDEVFDGFLIVPGVEVHGPDHQTGFEKRGVHTVFVPNFLPRTGVLAKDPVADLRRPGAGEVDVVEIHRVCGNKPLGFRPGSVPLLRHLGRVEGDRHRRLRRRPFLRSLRRFRPHGQRHGAEREQQREQQAQKFLRHHLVLLFCRI